VRAALTVFSSGGSEFREMLRVMQEQSAQAERFEDAAHYRDAIRALDRTLAALAIARRAAEEPVVVVVEGDELQVTVIVVVRGWRFCSLRFTRDAVDDPLCKARIATAVHRAVRAAGRNLPVTPRRLRDMAIIHAYRQQQAPLAIRVDDDASGAAESVASAIRRLMRVPRKHHAAVSGD
jgi:excinuclease UvrABC nuclease subunit